MAAFKKPAASSAQPKALRAETPRTGGPPAHRSARSDSKTLTDSDQRFRLFAEAVRDYAIFMLDAHGCVATWNDGAARIKGYQREEIVGQPVTRFYPPEDVADGLPERLLRTAAAHGGIEHEGWRVRKDGSRFWARVSITALRNERGGLEGFGKVTRDLTERRQAEETLKELSWKLLDAQDRERKRISLSLSDNLSPVCEELLAELQRARGSSGGAAAEHLDRAVALGEWVSREIRSTSYLLYPPSLEADGLSATLRTHLTEVAKVKEIPIATSFPAQMPRLPPALTAAVYHVAQEFLAGILHDPGISRAEVSLAAQHGHLILQVITEGHPRSPEALAETRRGAGDLGVTFLGIHARIARLGGSLEIDSSHTRTWITAIVPIA